MNSAALIAKLLPRLASCGMNDESPLPAVDLLRSYRERYEGTVRCGRPSCQHVVACLHGELPGNLFERTTYGGDPFPHHHMQSLTCIPLQILYLPGTILAVFLMERYGLRVCLTVGAALNAVSAWIRYAACFIPDPHTSYAVLLVGQCFGGLAQPIFTNLPSRIAGDWFPVTERDLGTVAGAMSNPLGNAVGSVVPSLLVNGPDDIPLLMIVQAGWSTALALGVLIFVRDRPPTPPSAGAAGKLNAVHALQHQLEHKLHPHHGHHHDGTASLNGDGATLAVAPSAASAAIIASADTRDGRASSGSGSIDIEAASASAAIWRMLADFRMLLTNGNYLRLLIAFGIGVGLFNALLTLLAQVLSPCGYGSTDAGIAGGALLGAGLISAIIMGLILEKTKAYVPLLKAGIVFSLTGTVFMLLALRPGNSAMSIASWGVMGFALLPLLPVSLENASECTYPIPEDNSSGLLLLAGQMFGIGFIFLLGNLLSAPPSSDCSSVVTPLAGVILGSILLAAAVLLTFKKDYRRAAAEAARNGTRSAAAVVPEAEGRVPLLA